MAEPWFDGDLRCQQDSAELTEQMLTKGVDADSPYAGCVAGQSVYGGIAPHPARCAAPALKKPSETGAWVLIQAALQGRYRCAGLKRKKPCKSAELFESQVERQVP